VFVRTLTLFGRQPLVGQALAAGVFVGSWVLLRHFFYAYDLVGDTAIYQHYGSLVRAGELPYRDFPFEYPPGSLPVLVGPNYASDYQTAFGWLMAACGGLTLLAVYRVRPAAAWFVAVSPLLVGALVLNRFDFWPTLLVTLGVTALLGDRHRLGWAALAAAIAAKIWAVSLMPLVLVWTLRRRGGAELARCIAAAIGVLAAAFAPFAILAPHQLWNSLHDQLTRPLQVETLPAAVLILTHHAGIVDSYTTQAVTGQAVGWLQALLALTEVAVLLGLWIAFARGPVVSERFVRYVAACVAAFVVLGRVLSPQYLIWLVPLAALVPGRRGRLAAALVACAAILGQFLYPRYFEYVNHGRLAWLVLLRDLLLVGLLVVLASPGRRARAAEASVGPDVLTAP
jgi:hypothetical protein